MASTLLIRKELNLSSVQLKMISSGWGSKTVNETVVEKVFYLSDGFKIQGYVAYPKDQTKKYPCIIWCRGGYGNDGMIDEFNARGMFGQLASWGYVVFASNYRGSKESEGFDEFGGNDVNDILNLVQLAEEIPCANKILWGIEGWSRGGLMTYIALTQTNIFKAAIVSGGIADMHCSKEQNEFLDLIKKANPEVSSEELSLQCSSRSAINFSEKLCKTTPILLLHGTKDERVSFSDSKHLSEKLTELKHEHKLVLLDGGDHFLKTHRKEVDLLRKDWFQNYLK